jgi:CheY-like chemotaxis protein
MPELDGFELTRQVKADAELGSTVIMMLTSGDRPGDIARCEQLGVAAYLLKPIHQSELLESILMALGAASPQRQPQDAAAEETPPLRPLRILLAEDSLVNQKLAVGLLSKHGHTVIVADDGREAVAFLAVQEVDLVLMDVQMPCMDGFEATAAIRTKEKHSGKHVPIIAMTAHAMKGDRERCLAAGMDDYVAKPISAKHLLAKVSEVLATSSGVR